MADNGRGFPPGLDFRTPPAGTEAGVHAGRSAGRDLEQILLALKKAGYVGSKRGIRGGFYLLKPPQQILPGDIVRLFEEPEGAGIRPRRQVAFRTPEEAGSEERQALVEFLAGVLEAAYSVADNVSLSQRAQRVGRIRDEKQARLV